MPHDVIGPAPRILVVEDEEDAAWLTCAVLKQFGFAALRAADAKEALGLLEAGIRFSAVVSDHNLPGMKGRELVAEVKRRWNELPVVMITGAPEEFDVPCLRKPFPPQQLADVLRSLVNRG